MITKETFEKMQELYRADRGLVNGLMSSLSYFDFMQFNWAMSGSYDEYLQRAQIDRENIESTYTAIIMVLKEKHNVIL